MSTRKVIAAIGAQGVGKDYLMNRLQQRLIYAHYYYQRTVRCRFADTLNEAVAPILGISSKELQDRNLKEVKRFSFGDNRQSRGNRQEWSSRDVQKRVAELLRENLGEDVFIGALDRKYNSPASIILISDLRYRNELDWVRSQGGKVVYIHNEKAAQAQYKKESVTVEGTWNTQDQTRHFPPESEMLQWDFYEKIHQTPDYWLDNNDFSDIKPFENFVQYIVNYLEE